MSAEDRRHDQAEFQAAIPADLRVYFTTTQINNSALHIHQFSQRLAPQCSVLQSVGRSVAHCQQCTLALCVFASVARVLCLQYQVSNSVK